jgi:hypothetical protein
MLVFIKGHVLLGCFELLHHFHDSVLLALNSGFGYNVIHLPFDQILLRPVTKHSGRHFIVTGDVVVK